MMGLAVFFAVVATLAAYPVVTFFMAGLTQRWGRGQRLLLKWGLALLIGAVCAAFRLLAIALLYLLAFLMLTMLLHRLLGNRWQWQRLYKSGILPILATAAVMICGYFNMNTVVPATYEITDAKLLRDYRVVFLSDIHYGTVQDGDLLEKTVEEINALAPDLVILGGDMLDETGTKEDMLACFEILGKLESTYGTFYVYGNHDRQRYSQSPAYSEEELRQTVEARGIAILQDEFVLIGEDLQLLGREDLGAGEERRSARILMRGLVPQRFLITADHQPFDAENNTLLGAGLQLSGHTHFGQIFPLGWFSFLFRGYPYGQYQIEEMTMIVSSGVAGWSFPIRTQGHCEYVVVELKAGQK